MTSHYCCKKCCLSLMCAPCTCKPDSAAGMPKLPEPVSIIGHGPVVNFTSVLPALKSKPHGQIRCYAEDDLHTYARTHAAAVAAPLVSEVERLRNELAYQRGRYKQAREMAKDDAAPLVEALEALLSGSQYIENTLGGLYAVPWEKRQQAITALAAFKEKA